MIHSKTEQAKLLLRVKNLIELHKSGALGGERMPEDANPGLEPSSAENYLYFTLPMSLNFQRNSYALWEAVLKTFEDTSTRFVFQPQSVLAVSEEELRAALLKYKVALQPTKHIEIWRKICTTLHNKYADDVRVFLSAHEFRIGKILETFQGPSKKDFPYLCGPKIGNYWLYVLSQYTDAALLEKECLSVAPDTHVIQASVKLGLCDGSSVSGVDVARKWVDALSGTGVHPIDIHTPMWLWSRRSFEPNV